MREKIKREGREEKLGERKDKRLGEGVLLLYFFKWGYIFK